MSVRAKILIYSASVMALAILLVLYLYITREAYQHTGKSKLFINDYSRGNKDKEEKYNRWRTIIKDRDGLDVSSHLSKIASEVKDEDDFHALFHIIAFSVDDEMLGKLSLFGLLEACEWKGESNKVLRKLSKGLIPTDTDIHRYTMNTCLGEYLYRFGTSQYGRRLDTWTIGDVWLLRKVTADPFPRIIVRIETCDPQKAREEALNGGGPYTKYQFK